MDNHSQYEKSRSDAHAYLLSHKPIHSPVLNEYIHFTAEGFNHILYKGSRHERDRESQQMRFKLLTRATKLIAISTTYQEYEERMKECVVKVKKTKVKKTKRIQYWGIIAIIDNRKIKVIVRKIGDNGQMHFWSIVPAWVTNKYRDTRFVSTMKGNPEED